MSTEEYFPITIQRTEITCDWYNCEETGPSENPIIHVKEDKGEYVHYKIVI